tara:strand:- start:1046 stop:1606 length:561 start_codon:yes stop_codon:yes gene_type:complete
MRLTEFSDFGKNESGDEINSLTLTVKIPMVPKALLMAHNAFDTMGDHLSSMAFEIYEDDLDLEGLKPTEAIQKMPVPWRDCLMSLRRAFRVLHHVAMESLSHDVDADSSAARLIGVFADLENEVITAEEFPQKLLDVVHELGDVIALDLDEHGAESFKKIVSGEVKDPRVLSELAAIVTANLLEKG